MAYATVESVPPLFLGLHCLGRGDVILPVVAAYDGEHYRSELTYSDPDSVLTNATGGRYDAIAVYDHAGRRIDLIPIDTARVLLNGDVVRVQVQADMIGNHQTD